MIRKAKRKGKTPYEQLKYRMLGKALECLPKSGFIQFITH